MSSPSKIKSPPTASLPAGSPRPEPPEKRADVETGLVWRALRRFGPVALLALVLLAPFASILLSPQGRVLGEAQADCPKAYYHYGYFLGQCWKDGIVPLWNPHIMLGIPFLGEGQASVFHPLSFLFAVLKPSVAINWLVAVSFVLTGLFFYGYLRALGLSRPASWCGAMTWSFSSAMISRIYAGHLNILLTFISLPLIMMFWERYRTGGQARHLAGIAVGYALMILAFYPQVLYIFSLFFLLYVLLQNGSALIARTAAGASARKTVLRLGLFIGLGIGLGAIQLLPSLDFVSRSFRQEATQEFCGTFSFAPENLLTLMAPQFFGSTLEKAPGRYWGRNLFWEMWLYAGILPLLLAVAGAWAAPRTHRLALLGGAVVFLIFGLGKHTFLFPLFYEWLPLFDVFRGSSKHTLITLFCLVTFSAYGFDALFGPDDEPRRQRFRRVALVAGAILFLAGGAAAMFLLREPMAPDSPWERFVKGIWASGELRVPILTQDWQEIGAITAQGATSALSRGMFLLILSMGLVALTIPPRWQKRALCLPIALILVDLLGVFLPLRQTFDKSISQAPLAWDESQPTPYPPRILVPFNPMPNLAMRSGYSSVFGLAGNTLQRYNDFISHLQNLDPRTPRSESRFMKFTSQFSLLGFDAVAVKPEDLSPQAKSIGKLGDKVLAPFYENDLGQRRAFLAESPVYFSRREDALFYALSNYTHALASPAIERAAPHLPAHPLAAGETVRFIAFQPNQIKLEVQAKHPRELVLGSMFERNWKATVNERPAPIEPANYVFRAVQVPAGTSRVVFDYRPAAFYWGAAITLLSLGLLGWLTWLLGRAKPERVRLAQI